MNIKKYIISPQVQDQYTATSAEVYVVINGPSGARYEYKSPNFNEV